ncbi:UNVERIFIED_ORG: hypothetical protein ABIB63_003242 [Xanthomonas axonopodis]
MRVLSTPDAAPRIQRGARTHDTIANVHPNTGDTCHPITAL